MPSRRSSNSSRRANPPKLSFPLSDRAILKLLVIPALAILLGVTIYPLLFAYYMSVHDMTIVNFWNPRFIELRNYIEIISRSDFWYSIRFSIFFMIIVTVIEFAVGLGMAVLLDRPMRGKRAIISMILIPMGIAPALFGIMMKLMLNEFVGIVPYLLKQLGITYNFFRDFTSSLITLIWVDVIQWTPFIFIIIYASLQALPRDPIEAAIVDGASRWQVFRYVTFPMLRRTILIVIIFRIMDALKTFDTIYVMTGGGPGISTTTLSVYIFKLALILGDYGLAAAATIIFLYLAMVVVSFALRFLRREEVI